MRDMHRVAGRHRVVAVHRVVAKHRVLAAVGAAVALMLVGAGGAAVGILASATQVRTVSETAAVSQPGVIRTGSVVRSNVAATHSPQLESMLAGHPAVAPKAASVRQAGVATTASAVEGIDVSSAQHLDGTINWSDVANAGYKFAFIKASEGSYYVNPYYQSDLAGAQAAGMFAAPYAFAIPNYSGGALQADYMLDNADYAPDGHILPPILDIEYDPYGATGTGQDGTKGYCYGLTPAQMVAWISAFTAEFQRRTGQHPVIYSTQQWWDTCTKDSAAFTADPLWIANYDVSSPAMPAAWQNWIYWQYTSSATVPGISGSTDVSWLSSTALELAAPATQSNRVSSQADLRVNALYAGLAPTYTGPPVAYSATGLPTGTQIDAASGAVSGTLPATSGTFPVGITASATGDPNATQTFSWYVHRKVTLANLTSQTASVGAPVRDQIRAKDGLSACNLQFSASGLPRGLTISSCGMISGWPLSSRTYTATVRATDSSGAIVAQGSVSWKVGRASGKGPAGHVVLGRDGKCLTERSATDIAIETCSGAGAERWTFAADGSLRIGGKCLAAKSGSAPAALHLTPCTGAQRWQLDTNAVLESPADGGRCLAGTGSKNGSRAVAATCQATSNTTGSASTPSKNQQWTVPAGPLTSDIAGYCASTLRPARGPSNAVTLRRCTTSGTQDWTVEPDGALSAAGKCLRTATGTVSPGTVLRLVACAPGAADQVWQLAGGPVGVQLVNPAAGLCLADPGDAATAGTTLRMEPCVATDPGASWRVS
jgi:GH25 family lysozyme M1 (1,4-beta-N-acetylmuramidase)